MRIDRADSASKKLVNVNGGQSFDFLRWKTIDSAARRIAMTQRRRLWGSEQMAGEIGVNSEMRRKQTFHIAEINLPSLENPIDRQPQRHR